MTCSSHFQLKHCAAFIYFGSELLLSPCYVIKSQLNLFSTLKRNSWVSLLGRLQQQQLSELLGLFVREARCLNPPLHPPILCYLFSDTEYNISADPNPPIPPSTMLLLSFLVFSTQFLSQPYVVSPFIHPKQILCILQ